MKVARILSLLAVALATAGSTAAQPAAADIELKSLRVLAAPRPTGAPNRTAEQAETERRQQAAAYVTAADQAKAKNCHSHGDDSACLTHHFSERSQQPVVFLGQAHRDAQPLGQAVAAGG